MDRLKLVLPTAADEQAIWDYREEFFNNNDQHLDGTGALPTSRTLPDGTGKIWPTVRRKQPRPTRFPPPPTWRSCSRPGS